MIELHANTKNPNQEVVDAKRKINRPKRRVLTKNAWMPHWSTMSYHMMFCCIHRYLRTFKRLKGSRRYFDKKHNVAAAFNVGSAVPKSCMVMCALHQLPNYTVDNQGPWPLRSWQISCRRNQFYKQSLTSLWYGLRMWLNINIKFYTLSQCICSNLATLLPSLIRIQAYVTHCT